MQIGWVIVGGMSFGTLLTLFVVPSVYAIMGRKSSLSPPAAAGSDDLAPRPSAEEPHGLAARQGTA